MDVLKEDCNLPSPGSIVICEISSLYHEARDDSVETAVNVPVALNRYQIVISEEFINETYLLSSTQGTEVLRGLGYHVAAQEDDDATRHSVPDLDVEVDLRVPLLLLGVWPVSVLLPRPLLAAVRGGHQARVLLVGAGGALGETGPGILLQPLVTTSRVKVVTRTVR